jgi:CysZ protein
MPPKRTALREFFRGVGMLGRGFGTWRSDPRAMLLGAIPALIVAVVYVAGLTVLLLNLPAITVSLTSFADEWEPVVQGLLRGLFALAFLVVFAFFWVYTYTAVTLAVGDPFYERIWRTVEQRLGSAPVEPEIGFWRGFGRAVLDFLRLLIPTLLLGIMVFAIGLIPVVGGVVAVVLGAFIGGWFLAVETTGLAFDTRGHTLRERRRMLRSRRALTLGFGVASYLLFLVPGLTVFAMPAAVAGATHLSREVLSPAADGQPVVAQGAPPSSD